MKSIALATAAALLTTGALAVPTVGHKHAAAHKRFHHKRADEIVWVTEFEVETVTVVETVYGNGGAAASSPTAPAVVDTPAPVTVTSYQTPSAAAPSSSLPAQNNNNYQPPAAPAPVTTPSTTSEAPVVTSTTSSVSIAPPAPTTPYTTAAAAVTTSVYVAPAPAAPSSSAASAASGTYAGAGSTSPGASYKGDFTHWDPATGACGVDNTATDAVVAISQTLFDPHTPGTNPNNNPLCGRTVSLIGTDGKTYTAKVVDRCVGCAQGDLDLTSSLFNTVTNNGDGRVSGMSWSWN